MERFNFKPFELQEWNKVTFERLDSAASVLALPQMTNPDAGNFQLCVPLRKTSVRWQTVLQKVPDQFASDHSEQGVPATNQSPVRG